jgi:signal peptidase II
MSRATTVIASLLLIAGLTGCDLATKHVAQQNLRGQPPTVLLSGVAELRYAENRDTAFGLLRAIPAGPRRVVILGLKLGVLALLGWLWWSQRARTRRFELLGYALVLAGALGNLADRLFRGYVVDFIHVSHWPIFNVADVLIVVGVGLLALGYLRPAKPPQSSTQSSTA